MEDWLKFGNKYKLKDMRVNGMTPAESTDEYELINYSDEKNIALLKNTKTGEQIIVLKDFIINPEKADDRYVDVTMTRADNMNENCSASCVGSANVSGFAKPLGEYCSRIKTRAKDIKKKRNSKQTNESFDVILFRQMVNENNDAVCSINGNRLSFKVVDDKPYMFVNESIAKTNNKEEINKIIDECINEKNISIELLEGFSVNDLQRIIQEDMNVIKAPQDDVNTADSLVDKTPDEQKKTDDLITDIGQKNIAYTDDEKNETKMNQELVGYDKTVDDFVIKDPATGEIKVVKSTSINKMA